MKRTHFFVYSKMCVMALTGASALFLASCARDGFDPESFSGGVSNTQMTALSADDITITASADGKSQTITWPVIMGAGGYRVTLIDTSNAAEPIVNDSIVDGCTITAKREEDVNYKLTILTLGNARLNNSDAAEAAEKTFSTFTPTYMAIPAGSDLNAWFAANPVPADKAGQNLNYDLEGGATYTVSAELDFDGQPVTLRSTSKTNHAKVVYTAAESAISFAAALNVKYLDFDCSATPATSSGGVFGFSKAPTVEPDATWGFVIIKDPVTFVNCNFKGVNGYFFTDNRKDQKVAAVTMLVDNCVVELTPSTQNNGGVFWTNKGGHINNLTVSNSTFYNRGEGDVKYFYQAGMYRAKDIGLGGTGTDQGGPGNSLTYQSCTFYRIGHNGGQWGNYNGMQGKADSFWTMKDCIFYACSAGGGVPRRFLHGQTYQSYPGNKQFANNTYMQADGTFDNVGDYDQSGTQIEQDPQFKDAANGDFTVGGATQLSRKTGDPRWLP